MKSEVAEYGIGDQRESDYPPCPECESAIFVGAHSDGERSVCHLCGTVFGGEDVCR